MLSAPAPGLYTCLWPLLSNIFLSETAWSIKTKLYVEPFWEVGASIYKYGLCHMTKMTAIPVYGKNFKNLYLCNLKSYDLETWHGTLETQALQSYIDDDPGLT